MKNLKASGCPRNVNRLILEDFLTAQELKKGMEYHTTDYGTWIIGEIWNGISELEAFVIKEESEKDDVFGWNLSIALDEDDFQREHYKWMKDHPLQYQNKTILLIYQADQDEEDDNWCFVVYGIDPKINVAGFIENYNFQIDSTNRWRTSDRLEDTNTVSGVFESKERPDILTDAQCKKIKKTALADMNFFAALKPELLPEYLPKYIENKETKEVTRISAIGFKYQPWAEYGLHSGTTPIKTLNGVRSIMKVLETDIKLQMFKFQLFPVGGDWNNPLEFNSKADFLKTYDIPGWAESDKLLITNKNTGVFENIYIMRIKKFNEHWTDSETLNDIDDSLGVFDDVDTIIADEDNVMELPELEHIMTDVDDQKIRSHYNKTFGMTKDNLPNINFPKTFVGKTVERAASETDKLNGGDYFTEYLLDFIHVLFPKKYKAN